LKAFADEVQGAGFSDILLLGMGGSSLCPEVLSLTYPQIAGLSAPAHPRLDRPGANPQRRKENRSRQNALHRLQQIRQHARTEHLQAIFLRARAADHRAEKAGSHFIAITDPGSKMQQVAERDRFRHIFYGLPSIGGRYSALSNFGMIPAAAMGLDTGKFLSCTKEMVEACKASAPVEQNPGVMLGLIMGSAAKLGRDKITLIASPGISDLGAWLEQLIAESTGKLGKGIIPVDRESLGAPDVYGNDRIFAYLRLEGASDAAQDAKVAALEKAGQPVVRIAVADTYSLGQEFFRWEIATAVAGSILGINAFNQPDVEASKIVTKQLTSEYESQGLAARGKADRGRSGLQALHRREERRRSPKTVGSDRSLRTTCARISRASAPATISRC
jgi:transaldolase / glucose-6-phosphate isomerase